MNTLASEKMEKLMKFGLDLDTSFGGVEHSGQIETWDAFLTRDVVPFDGGDGIRLVPRVQVRERTAFEARQAALTAFSREAGIIVDQADVALKKVAA
jgi:hypothetical protein